MERWRDLVAVVTGASSGIGKAVALRLAQEGMIVCLLARRAQRLQEMCDGYGGPGKLIAYPGNVTDVPFIEETFKKIRKEVGEIRVLVNNAGIALQAPLNKFDVSEWRALFDLNLFALMECTKRVYEAAVEHHHPVHIINMNSLAGHYSLPNMAAPVYTASKHSITLLTRALIRQASVDNLPIKFTSLSPGVTDTEIFDASNVPEGSPVRMGPSLSPDDVAAALIDALSAPPNTIYSELTIKPLGELF